MPAPAEQLDVHDWQALSVSEVTSVMHRIDVRWWIAGGWAIDLFLGRQTRPHGDIDVLVLRRDQLGVQRHLSEWRLYKTKQPTPSKKAPWPKGEYLSRDTDIFDVWVKQELGGPWRLQLMLMESEADRWVFRRDERIGGPVNELGWHTSEGTPVLRPEVQLLYKGRLEGRRAKDDADFAAVLPHLTEAQRRWLGEALRLQFGDAHPWPARLT